MTTESLYEQVKPRKSSGRYTGVDGNIPCPLSETGFCLVAREKGREFYCGSYWWKSCGFIIAQKEASS